MSAVEQRTILSIKDVNKSFPGVRALSEVSVDIKIGSVHGIVGENGAGKSTLMKVLSGVYEKDSGTIIFDGETIGHTTPLQSIQRGLSIIYQEFNLVDSMSVGENIFLGRFKEMRGMRGTHSQARELLDSIGSSINTYSQVSDLSVSEKQMVEIAKALSFDSKLIIMDEPSSSLTEDELKKLVDIIHNLRERGISIIYISHKLEEIFEFCDTVTVMRDGHIIETRPTTEYTRPEMISQMIGRSMENEFPPRPMPTDQVVMEVRSLNTRKLHDVSFTLRKGEILGLVGLVGSGRSEIVRALFGVDKVRGHKIIIDDKEVRIKNPINAKNSRIGFVPEDRKNEGLVLPFSVEANISMAILRDIKIMGAINKAAEKEIAERYKDLLGIKTPSIKTKVGSLSGGNQQKCIVGRWLSIEPRILILDEPTRGIDVGTKYEIYVLMKEIAENGGSIILISSELPEVLNMSNRVLTICDGHITGEFDPQTADTGQIVEKTLEFRKENPGYGQN